MRIEGRKSDDGQFYELSQGGKVKQRIPIEEAQAKLGSAIARNKWEAL